MQYFGGKQRIAKQLAEVIAPQAAKRGIYVEPFVGSAAMMSQMIAQKRIGRDANAAIITMWRALASGWSPPDELSEGEYNRLKSARDSDDPLTAFAGFGCSFAGKWFGGYARRAEPTNFAGIAKRSLSKKLAGLGGVEWETSDYRAANYPAEAVIYCDPPYANTTSYGAVGKFDSVAFWDFCRDKHELGHAVFVSEYVAPDDFVPCLVIETRTSIRTKENGCEARTEKLFVPRGCIYGR